MPRYLVASREYETINPVLEDGSGPSEWGRDELYVDARTKREAKVLALREFRKQHVRFLHYYSDESPFTGMLVLASDEQEKEE